MQGLVQANLAYQHQQQQQMCPAEQMRQSTLTQCFNGTVAAAPAPTQQPTPLPAHISCVPPGYHYYENNGNCYFLNLASGEKVALGPVEPASAPELPASVPAPALVPAAPASVVRVAALEPSSFLTPTVKKRRTRAIVTSEAESSFDCGPQRRRKKKKTIVTVTRDEPVDTLDDNQPVAEVEVLTVLDSDSIDSSQLPKTGHFTCLAESEAEASVTSFTPSEVSDTVYDRQLGNNKEQSQQSINLLDANSSSDSSDGEV
jgi:hypothetical protein